MSKAKFTEVELKEALSKFTQSAQVEVQEITAGYNKEVYIYKEPEDGKSQGSSQ